MREIVRTLRSDSGAARPRDNTGGRLDDWLAGQEAIVARGALALVCTMVREKIRRKRELLQVKTLSGGRRQKSSVKFLGW